MKQPTWGDARGKSVGGEGAVGKRGLRMLFIITILIPLMKDLCYHSYIWFFYVKESNYFLSFREDQQTT